MRPEIKEKLHCGHQGLVKMKLRSRESVYWPGISKEIEEMLSQCNECQELQNQQPSEPLQHHEVPTTPWMKVGTDIFHISGKHYIIVVDYTSKFFDLSEIPDGESTTVVRFTKPMFARYGIPKVVISDNGPQFSAGEYKRFAKEWDFTHTTSSPRYPQSNGLVERTIQTVKKTIRKCKISSHDTNLAFLALCTTPLQTGSPAPASILYNRKIRCNLPTVATEVAKPKPCKGKDLPVLNEGDNVRIHDGQTWSRRGTILTKAAEPRSYMLKTEDGKTLRRN
jgi:transposase InsO family protein